MVLEVGRCGKRCHFWESFCLLSQNRRPFAGRVIKSAVFLLGPVMALLQLRLWTVDVSKAQQIRLEDAWTTTPTTLVLVFPFPKPASCPAYLPSSLPFFTLFQQALSRSLMGPARKSSPSSSKTVPADIHGGGSFAAHKRDACEKVFNNGQC